MKQFIEQNEAEDCELPEIMGDVTRGTNLQSQEGGCDIGHLYKSCT